MGLILCEVFDAREPTPPRDWVCYHSGEGRAYIAFEDADAHVRARDEASRTRCANTDAYHIHRPK
jgi:hypothetical protein